ncbi:LuxS/MPP-like metallohydrolase [Trichodelitschia bisporula]|uniref:Cytochrome b-c1 complex subunit 2, mitochondrial n=1 Tax=Trichodelitschia bisporula TaxID=703511 RepID=A0A6G1HLX4_9PEZI|nr:LuxS/MPP-like metallohydrolase [Trichodelitschia bisporula]
MIARPSVRTASKALRCLQCGQRRGYAAAASGFNYQTGDSAGIKYASRDVPGQMTTLALVAKAGTRYEFLPGLAEGLEKFAFRNTERRSALRIVRETELLGSEVYATHSRETLSLNAKFLRKDLPYFMELLSEVAGKTQYLPYIFEEEVFGHIKFAQKNFLANPEALALDSAHGVAFHRGLGSSIHPAASGPTSKYLDHATISAYASTAYAKSNIAVVANGADNAEVGKWVGEFFGDYQVSPVQGAPQLSSSQSKYYGGEERIAHAGGNAIVLGFSGSSSATGGFYKPEVAVLAALLGGQSSIKWSSGFSLLSKAGLNYPSASIKTKSHIYSDAGLLTVTITGGAKDVAGVAFDAVKTLNAIAAGEFSNEDFKKAVAYAKFAELEYGESQSAGVQLTGSGLVQGGKPYQIEETSSAIGGVTSEKLKQAAKSILEHKASVSAVGDLHLLPFAEELGLKV